MFLLQKSEEVFGLYESGVINRYKTRRLVENACSNLLYVLKC